MAGWGSMQRETMEYDVVIVGAGPSGLAAAIRLKQLAAAAARELAVCVIEKGSEVGAHILSGAVFEPRALDELIPDWKTRGAPLNTPATEDRFVLLTATRAIRLPTPPQMNNHGNYIISLGNLCRWLAGQAEALGVEIYPGFAAAEVLYDETGRVRGVATGSMGVG
jgi:electron-transferring-flavoprotein dehydrogenase